MYESFILGLIALFIGININNKRKRLLKTGIHVKGVVIRLEEQEVNGRNIYLPVVQIEAENRVVTMRTGANIPQKIGSTMEILYDPANPDDAKELTASMSTPSIIFIIVGSVILFIGVIISIFKVMWHSM